MANRWTSLSPPELKILLRALSKLPDADSLKLRKKLHRLTKRITISSAKGKGRELQKRTAERIAELIGIPFDQQDDESLIRYREMGQPGTDVVLRGKALLRFPFSIECKSTESFELIKTIEQVQANQRPGTEWLIVHRSKRVAKTIVIMEWDALDRLYRGIL